MVRSFPVRTMLTALVWTGLTWGPSWGQPATGSNGPGQIITVQEKGQSALRCRVLCSWALPDGGRAHQVQHLESQEMLTIVETGPRSTNASPGTPFQVVATRIWHWGKNNTPPPGAPPAPPGAAVLVQQPASVPGRGQQGQLLARQNGNRPATAFPATGQRVWPRAYDDEPTQPPVQAQLAEPEPTAPPQPAVGGPALRRVEVENRLQAGLPAQTPARQPEPTPARLRPGTQDPAPVKTPMILQPVPGPVLPAAVAQKTPTPTSNLPRAVVTPVSTPVSSSPPPWKWGSPRWFANANRCPAPR